MAVQIPDFLIDFLFPEDMRGRLLSPEDLMADVDPALLEQEEAELLDYLGMPSLSLFARGQEVH